MALNIHAVREALQKQERNTDQQSTKTTDNAIYKFWDMTQGQEAVVRFLPDGNPDNTLSFWALRQTIKLPFIGVVGGDTDKEVFVQVPCVDMYGDKGLKCPITAEIAPWWKTNSNNDELHELARKYYRKNTYIFQGFVVKSPFQEPSVPENPIRRFSITPQVFNPIKTSLLDPDMENLPTDYVGGRDFKIKKTKKGEYADWSSSSWAMSSRDLSKAELDAIEQYGLFDLSSFIPKKPTTNELNIIVEMFHDSVNGLPYDPAKYEQYYKPWGFNSSEETAETTVAPAPAKKVSVVPVTPVQSDEQPQVETSVDESKSKAADILAKLRKNNS